MDIFGPHHTELRLFLKKYLKMEMDDVVDVTIIRLTKSYNISTYKQSIWEIEVACRDGLRGKLGYEDLMIAIKKYIALFGEESHNIKLSRVFIVDEVRNYRTTE